MRRLSEQFSAFPNLAAFMNEGQLTDMRFEALYVGLGRKAYKELPGQSREAVSLKLSTFGKRKGIVDVHA